ncbi:glycosyltransferase family 2 protein [Aeoliella sp. ICT_H6.2]|uniref:Glycosyltransferase family 2 protein n=1 Tax=Aeoliella straminimaris TaxID=2954799 RepID=A0A9X2FGP4_9BACT|nr:glycosyltransferase family 2 protein [Aeoliella straminimaris]MCO6045351.1 glycosyltransferase family 2 protein [Aeoliella straminimaris]
MTETKILIVIVCYRSADLVIDCLHSLAPQIDDVPGTRVEICENGTGEESLAHLQAAIDMNRWSDWVSITPISPNRGFAGGNNVVLGPALASENPPRYLLLLNADTIVRPGAIRAMYDGLEAQPNVGILSPRLEWPDGTPQGSAFLDFTPLHEFIKAAGTGTVTRLFKRGHGGMPLSDEPHHAEWVSFACALIRREVFQKCGLLDEGYYLYYDDADYCRLTRQAGWDVLYYPLARVVHLRGRSNPAKSLAAEKRRRPRYWYISRARYYAKFNGRGHLWLANTMWWGGRLISLARELVGNRARSVCDKEGRDIWIHAWTPMKHHEPSDRQS